MCGRVAQLCTDAHDSDRLGKSVSEGKSCMDLPHLIKCMPYFFMAAFRSFSACSLPRVSTTHSTFAARGRDRERERERERTREGEREKERNRERETDRQTDRQRQTQRERQRYRHRDRQTDRQTDRQRKGEH